MQGFSHQKTSGHKQPTWPYLPCCMSEHPGVVNTGREGASGRENHPSKGCAVGFREADGCRGLGCHGYGVRRR